MGYICSKCFKIYKEGANKECGVGGCRGEIVQIDELLLPTIKVLNKKGYKTESCCSGHFDNLDDRCYIKFADEININNLTIEGYEVGSNNVIEKWFYYEDKESINIYLIYNAIFLLKWAIDLPTYVEMKLNDVTYRSEKSLEVV